MHADQQNGADAGAGGGSKEQPAPPTRPEVPSLSANVPPASVESTKLSLSSPPVTSVTLVSERPLPVVDVHVSASAPLPPTVPAFSSQYMVAVAIDFGLLHFSHTVGDVFKGWEGYRVQAPSPKCWERRCPYDMRFDGLKYIKMPAGGRGLRRSPDSIVRFGGWERVEKGGEWLGEGEGQRREGREKGKLESEERGSLNSVH